MTGGGGGQARRSSAAASGYAWVDREGRPTSPPQAAAEAADGVAASARRRVSSLQSPSSPSTFDFLPRKEGRELSFFPRLFVGN